jgi:methylated-DNA-[protein]-cysteine S-methyltransferase
MDADQTVAERWMSELEAYFAGKRLSWTSREIGLDDLGFGTFAKAVYKALLGVPPATTVSYGELAAMAGYPRAARAVGTAMATNPIPIVIPCHRVIRADGSLGRYGDDPAMKAGLLAHESVHAPTGRGTNVRNTG